MSTDGSSELRQFQQFLVEIVNRGSGEATPEEALDQWRVVHPHGDDLWAVQEALDDMHAGDAGVSLDEFNEQFQRKHGLADNS